MGKGYSVIGEKGKKGIGEKRGNWAKWGKGNKGRRENGKGRNVEDLIRWGQGPANFNEF